MTGGLKSEVQHPAQTQTHTHTLAACEALSGVNTACFQTKPVNEAIATFRQIARIAAAAEHRTDCPTYIAFAFGLQNRR